MTLPAARDWIFSLKTFFAGLLALYIAMWADLSRPYWALATVYIATLAFDGATQAKGVYRAFGTLIGAVASVAILPNVVNSPEITVIVVALWVSVCLYISLLDRSARSYTTMLAGYTVALIGFPPVDAPSGIFDIAVARTEEITLGIVCAALVSGVVLPRSAMPAFAAQLKAWLAAARAWTREVLRREPRAKMDTRAGRLKLAADAIALETFASQLHYEASRQPIPERSLDVLRQHMLMLLPLLTSISDRMKTIEGTEAQGVLQPLLNDIAEWFQEDDPLPCEAISLLGRLEDYEHPLRKGDLWHDLIIAGLADRLRELVNLKQDIRRLRASILGVAPLAGPLAFKYTAKAREIRHRDHAMALLSAFAAFISIIVVCAIWIATEWANGSTAVMTAAVTSCFFATMDDPVPAMKGFALSAAVGVAGAIFYQFVLMPQATSFEMVALALAPGLIFSGLLMTQPATVAIGTGAAVACTMTLALQSSYSADFPAMLNNGLAMVAGIWMATVCAALMRSLDSIWAAKRLHRQNRQSLALAASGRGSESGLELAALMLDRIGLMASRFAKLPPDGSAATGDRLREVRAGVNVVELRRVRRQLSKNSRVAINAVLAKVARHFRMGEDEPPPLLLTRIDEALRVTEQDEQTETVRAAMLGLVGLRRALFPGAPAPDLTSKPLVPAEAA